MLRITAIEAQKKNPDRVNIYLDDEFAFGLSRIVAAWLYVGQELTKEKIESLQAEDSKEVAFQRVMRFLSYRPRSIAEIDKYLKKHSFTDAVIDETIQRLERGGLVGDRQFARAWVENRNTFRPRGSRALRVELRQKGIADEVIQSVIDEMVDEDQLAYQAGSKRARRLSGLEWQEFRRKLGEYLARRGFSYPIIKATVSQIWSELHAGQEPD